MILSVVKVFLPSVLSFLVGILMAPWLTDYLYRNRMWKKKAGKTDLSGNATPIFNQLHKEKEVGTPRMGGIIIWASILVTTLLLWLIAFIFPGEITTKLNYLSRGQTWLPLFTLVIGSLVGLVDDWLQVREVSDSTPNRGLPFRKRLIVVVVLALIASLWFYFKLNTDIRIPFYGFIDIGLWFIPLFIVVMIGIFSSGVIDGLDGLSGGVMATIFSAYAIIAYFQDQIDLAAFCAVTVGGILAFLWFNIPPARFYMSETGILGLTTALTVVAFLTNTVFTLPIIALPLVATSASNVIQITSKKFRGKKVFLVAPLHHHFEAIGWPAYKVVMRYWVISVIAALIGVVITLISY